MKAIYIKEYGNAQKLIQGEVPRPTINDHEVLIKIQAAAINPVDWMVREGLLADGASLEQPLILGWDAAGTVCEMGKNVKDFTLGDEVFVYAPILEQGSYAQYIAVDAGIVARKPTSLDITTSAAVPLAATTAFQALTQGGKLQKGQTVLIHNAAGGVGSFAVQIAKSLGAHVIGTASNAKREFVMSLGCDEFIDYQSQDFSQQLNNIDMVLAAVGGEGLLEKSLRIIKPNGALISLLDDMDPAIALDKQIHFQRWWVTPNAQDLNSISKLIDEGSVRVEVDSVFPMSQVQKAHDLSQSQRAQGKIILQIPA
jgi:NADPH:quinone reductase-like Zn-dependent oxidoreductase